MANILLIEDMDGVRTAVSMILSGAGHTVSTAADGDAGLAKANQQSFDLVVTDILMPHVDGTEVIVQLKAKSPSLPILAISGGGANVPAEDALRIARDQADRVLQKPFSKAEVLAAVEELLTTKTS